MTGAVIDLDAPAQEETPEASEKIRDNGNGTKTLTLDYPVTLKTKVQGGPVKEERITELTFRRMTGGDVRALANIRQNEGEAMALIFKRLCGITDIVFDQIDAADLAEGGKIVEDFFPKSLRAGAAF